MTQIARWRRLPPAAARGRRTDRPAMLCPGFAASEAAAAHG